MNAQNVTCLDSLKIQHRGLFRMQTNSIKSKRVFTLRKTNSRIAHTPQPPEQNKSDIFQKQSIGNMQGSQNLNGAPSHMSQSNNTYGLQQSQIKKNQPQNYIATINEQEKYQALVEGQQLCIDKLTLKFQTELNNVQVQYLTVKNIGQSAIYFQWQCKNISKINASAIKDPKSRFYCHYENNVIQPGEEITFAFSFLSQIPGIFVQQFDLVCKPALKTYIPSIKLEGKAFVEDKYKKARQNFIQSLKDSSLSTDVQEILQDLVDAVKAPQPPLPDVSKAEIAESQFETKNLSLGLYYNPIVHGWFRELFNQVWNKINGVPLMETDKQAEQNQQEEMKQKPYWDQSIETLKNMINSASEEQIDQVEKICFLDRLYHYYHLSTFPSPNKSELFTTVRQYLYSSAYKLGGDFVDAARKELQMWQVPFREPSEEDTEASLKTYQEEVTKIKAEWAKKAKKKKWGEEQEKVMLQDFRNKVRQRVNQDILNSFTGFQDKAQFIKVEAALQKEDETSDLGRFCDFLERLKTVKETPLEGQKVLIKFNLKLKPNSEQKIKQLHQYIELKKQQQRRLEQEKKNQQQNAKKKKAPPKKKKGKEEQQSESKPLVFDFMSLLNQENWKGFVQTYKIVQEKSPMLILIGCSYGPRQGRYVKEYSIRFLLEHLRATVDSAIQFLQHEQLPQISEKLENQALAEGSIYLLENINFMPAEVLQKQQQIKKQQIGEQQAEQKPSTFQLRKLLYPEIAKYMKQTLSSLIDIVVTEDRLAIQASGIQSYLFKTNIIGTLWWKYISFSLRLLKNKSSNAVIIGGELTAEKLLVIGRLLLSAKEINCRVMLVGQIGIKFSLVTKWHEQNQTVEKNGKTWYGLTVKKSESDAISRFCKMLNERGVSERLIWPCDAVLKQTRQIPKQGQNQQSKASLTKIVKFDKEGKQNGEQKPSYDVIDTGNETIERLADSLQSCYIFVFDKPTLRQLSFYQGQQTPNSFASLIKLLHRKQDQKRMRHKNEQMSPGGVNYEKDIVVLMAGIKEEEVQNIKFKEPKAKKAVEGEEGLEQNEEAQQEVEPQDEEGKKKIDSVADFRLDSPSCVYRILSRKFMVGLRDVERYPKSED